MIKKHLMIGFTLLTMGNMALAASSTEPESPEMIVIDSFGASLNYRQGVIDLPNGMATVETPENFRYLAPADAYKVLVSAWGNPPLSAKTQGMILSTETSPLAQNSKRSLGCSKRSLGCRMGKAKRNPSKFLSYQGVNRYEIRKKPA